MQTISDKIKEIKSHSNSLQDIVNNYYCGFITMEQKHQQLVEVLNIIERIKKEIVKEYGINLKAIGLMLEL